MSDPHVITALARKRSEMAGEIEATHKNLSKLIHDLEKLDATLLMFDPEYDLPSIKPRAFRPPSDWSNRGEMSKAVLNIMRKATEPMTTRDVAFEVMSMRAVDTNDTKLLRLMTKRVGVALRHQQNNGVTRSMPGPGIMKLWEIQRPR